MPSFCCSACGYPYSDLGNFTSCPRCMGAGIAEKDCTCICIRMGMGTIRTARRKKKNPDCPVHGMNGTKPDPDNMYAPTASL